MAALCLAGEGAGTRNNADSTERLRSELHLSSSTLETSASELQTPTTKLETPALELEMPSSRLQLFSEELGRPSAKLKRSSAELDSSSIAMSYGQANSHDLRTGYANGNAARTPTQRCANKL